MVLDIYDKNIGVPGKCGSRFLTKTVPYWGEYEFRKSFIDFYNGKHHLEHIIIRNPLSHLKSALKTEILSIFDDRIKIGIILNSFCVENEGGTHFIPNFCQMVYEKWKESEWKLNVVDLSNLSKFIEEKLHNIEFNKTDYDFHDDPNIKLGIYEYKDKEEIWNRCVEFFPNKIKRLIEFTTEDIKWYDALLNNDRTLIPKINLIINPKAIYSLILYFGLTIEESYSKNNQIKICHMGVLEVGNYLYVDNFLFTEVPSPFYFNDITHQVFHIDLSSNIGMITKITRKLL